MMKKIPLFCLITLLMACLSVAPSQVTAAENPDAVALPEAALSLHQCIEIAFEKNRQRAISASAVAIARHQYQQAVSAYWPSLMVRAMASRLDEDPVLILPSETARFQLEGVTTSDISIPGVGTLPGTTLPPQETQLTIPERSIRLMDRDSLLSAIELTYPLYTGGRRSAVIRQARSNIAAARQASRRTDLQLMYDVKRMYYGVILADRLYQTAADAVKRLRVTMELTEQLYKEGTGTVKKTDFLKSKVMAESAQAIMESFHGNLRVARAALANTMGLSWRTEIRLAESRIPEPPKSLPLETLIGDAYALNPDWKQFQSLLEKARADVDREKAGHMPRLAFTGKLWRIDNSYDYGLVNEDNREGWKIGVGFQLPLFEGFLTREKVRAAKAYLKKQKGRQILLKQAIAMKIKHAFLLMDSYSKQAGATRRALVSARENRELNERAYEAAFVETDDVIESQMMESIMQARNQHVRFKRAEVGFLLEKLVGWEVEKQFEKISDDF